MFTVGNSPVPATFSAGNTLGGSIVVGGDNTTGSWLAGDSPIANYNYLIDLLGDYLIDLSGGRLILGLEALVTGNDATSGTYTAGDVV